MASGISRPLVSSLKGRMYSAAASQARKVPDEREPMGYVKKLDNGMLVGTIETKSPVARLAVVANAGSRYETGENLGVAHLLRHTTQLRTQNMTDLGITRHALQIGSDVICQGTREYLYYKSNVARNFAPAAVEILKELTTRQSFRAWELNDLQNNPDKLRLDLALMKTQPQVRVMEMLHAAAFRDGLGHSLYAPDFMVGKYTPEQLQSYVKTFFTSGRLALCGVGMDQNELEELASQFEPYSSAGVPEQTATFHGGELRENTGGELAYVAFAFGGPRHLVTNKKDKKEKPGSTNLGQTSKDLLPSEVLKHILGIGPVIKYSAGSATSQLGKAVAQASDSPFAVSSLTANYSDAGLFGFSAVAPSSSAEKVVRAAANQFKSTLSAGVSDGDVSRAKTQLKAAIAMLFEDPENLLSWLGEQTLNSDKILTPQEVYKMVDPITTADVNNVAKKIVSSRPAMAVTGNTSNVPYLDKLLS